MRINNLSKTNFQGYKNVIHNDISQDNLRFTFLSMQLNDEGVKDLTELRKIQAMQKIDSNSDVLTVFYSKKPGVKEYFVFNNRAMFSGEELRNLWEKYGSLPAYKAEERAALKVYKLVASLTRRMFHNGLSVTDNAFPHVVQETMESFMKIFASSPSSVFQMLQESIVENKQLEKTAFFINDIVRKNMQIFFK